MLQGTLTPLLGIGLCVSIQFGALEWSKRYFARQNALKGKGGQGGKTLTGAQLFSAGVFAGLANGVVSGPVEHIRIRKSRFNAAPQTTREFCLQRLTDPIEY
jgi:solute carrier family 25 carnitine/acylcarnitine transporter 20/29